MSDIADPTAPTAPPVAPHSAWRTEALETVRLAVPMAATQLGQIAMMTTDLALLGRLGETVVAGAALGHTVLFMLFALGLGIASAVAPLAAQAFGAREPRLVRRALRVGLQASVIVALPLMPLLVIYGADLLRLLGQPAEVSQVAGRYLAGLAWTLLPAWAFMCARSFMGSVGRPEPALWITLAAIPLNGLLAYSLINGAFGAPRLDILGAGIATALVNIAMLVAAIVVAVTQRPYRKYAILGHWWRYDVALMRRLVAIGLPISAAFALEIGLFSAAALLAGWIGTTALAAHQIALQAVGAIFMIPFGISMAATVRVGHAVGRGEHAAAARAGWTALAIAGAIALVMTLLIALFRDVIPGVFLGARTPANAASFDLASALMLIAATFVLADAIQTVALGTLRGYADTQVPFLIAIVSFWPVGFAASYVLAFPMALGAHGIWIGLSLGVICYAVLLVARFAVFARRPLPVIAVAA